MMKKAKDLEREGYLYHCIKCHIISLEVVALVGIGR